MDPIKQNLLIQQINIEMREALGQEWEKYTPQAGFNLLRDSIQHTVGPAAPPGPGVRGNPRL